MVDQNRICRNCGQEFTFTEGEQAFYEERGYRPPAYCPDCRDARRAMAGPGVMGLQPAQRPTYDAICSSCGEPTQVPFKPIPGRPVYCASCFAGRRASS